MTRPNVFHDPKGLLARATADETNFPNTRWVALLVCGGYCQREFGLTAYSCLVLSAAESERQSGLSKVKVMAGGGATGAKKAKVDTFDDKILRMMEIATIASLLGQKMDAIKFLFTLAETEEEKDDLLKRASAVLTALDVPLAALTAPQVAETKPRSFHEHVEKMIDAHAFNNEVVLKEIELWTHCGHFSSFLDAE